MTLLSRKLGAKPGVEVVVLLTTSREELERRFEALKATLAVVVACDDDMEAVTALPSPPSSTGGLWVAWPKKASGIETDLAFDVVQRIGLEAGLVDNKSAAIDDDWQAVRFVYRLSDRPRGAA